MSCISGDVFDESLILPDNQVGAIQLWIGRLLKLCKKWISVYGC